jgi:hypothetical protein
MSLEVLVIGSRKQEDLRLLPKGTENVPRNQFRLDVRSGLQA